MANKAASPFAVWAAAPLRVGCDADASQGTRAAWLPDSLTDGTTPRLVAGVDREQTATQAEGWRAGKAAPEDVTISAVARSPVGLRYARRMSEIANLNCATADHLGRRSSRLAGGA